MDKIKDMIEQIVAKDAQWASYETLEDVENEETQQAINALVVEIRRFIKQKDDSALAQFRSSCTNEKMYRAIVEVSEFTLRHYKAWSIVRELENNNAELVQMLLQNIMDKYVLRLEFDFQKTYEMYEIKEEDVFLELLSSYDTLVSYYIQRHFGKKAIARDVIDETSIKSENAEVVADLVERNYEQLQRNAILDGLQKLENRKEA